VILQPYTVDLVLSVQMVAMLSVENEIPDESSIG